MLLPSYFLHNPTGESVRLWFEHVVEIEILRNIFFYQFCILAIVVADLGSFKVICLGYLGLNLIWISLIDRFYVFSPVRSRGHVIDIAFVHVKANALPRNSYRMRTK